MFICVIQGVCFRKIQQTTWKAVEQRQIRGSFIVSHKKIVIKKDKTVKMKFHVYSLLLKVKAGCDMFK